jgi:hypothetical protein
VIAAKGEGYKRRPAAPEGLDLCKFLARAAATDTTRRIPTMRKLPLIAAAVLLSAGAAQALAAAGAGHVAPPATQAAFVPIPPPPPVPVLHAALGPAALGELTLGGVALAVAVGSGSSSSTGSTSSTN